MMKINRERVEKAIELYKEYKLHMRCDDSNDYWSAFYDCATKIVDGRLNMCIPAIIYSCNINYLFPDNIISAIEILGLNSDVDSEVDDGEI